MIAAPVFRGVPVKAIMTNLKDFIQEELNKRKRDYQESPAYILEHFNIEQQNIQAYNGRQLLEMLQNADDAAKQNRAKRIRIPFNIKLGG